MTDSSQTKWERYRFVFLIIAFASAFIFLRDLPHKHVPALDGSIRASMARHIVETNQWFPLFYENKIMIDHPPLYVWLLAVSMKIFGVSDWAANLAPCLISFLVPLILALVGLVWGFGPARILVSSLILLTTRDFILSSTRGYIEPLIECATYGSLIFLILALQMKSLRYILLATAIQWIGWWSKGPPMLWPFVFSILFLLLAHENIDDEKVSHYKWRWSFRIQASLLFVCFNLVLMALHYWALERSSFMPIVREYISEQVLSSALEGRHGSQMVNYFYFFDVLGRTYWPWLPFLFLTLILSFQQTIKTCSKKLPFNDVSMMTLLGLGFFAGFSLARWKFWYYIAPAYGAWALAISSLMPSSLETFLQNTKRQRLFALALIFIFLVFSLFPIPTQRNRTPEVNAFASTINHSLVKNDVLFSHAKLDHNLVAPSGNWYFHRNVIRTNLSNLIPTLEPITTSQISDNSFWLITDEWIPQGLLVGQYNETNLYLVRKKD